MTGGAAAAIIQAIRASGVIVRVEPAEFLRIVDNHPEPLIVKSEGGVFWTTYKYLTTYKGLAFYTQDRTPLNLPSGADIVNAKGIWAP